MFFNIVDVKVIIKIFGERIYSLEVMTDPPKPLGGSENHPNFQVYLNL